MAIFQKLFKKNRKNIALVLSSGGARGYAHIGAIDTLLSRGYNITSIAGTSFGSVVAAMYALGRLDNFKRWLTSVDKKKMSELTNYTLGFSYFMKVDRIIDELKRIAPDKDIEHLPIPFAAIATDWKSGKEVVFKSGSIWEAVRASISLPGCLEPVRIDDRILIDGGIMNPLPLNRVERTEDDLLVGVNVSGHDYIGKWDRKEKSKQWQIRNSKILSALQKILPDGISPDLNYYTLLSQTISLAISQNAHLMIKLTNPDITVDIPMKRYDGDDYDKYEAISRMGATKMERAIEEFMNK